GLARGQSPLGIPAIKNYNYSDYHAALAIWDMTQDRNGILYFANDEGLLSFDGSFWKIYSLPNKTPIRSVALDSLGRIWVGGQDELGYFFPDARGILRFHSIKNLLPPVARQFADIWNIVVFGDRIFFRTIECIFLFENNRITTFDAPGGWRLLTRTSNQVFAEDRSAGLQTFRNGKWELALHIPNPGLQITGVMDYRGDSLLVSTRQQGLFLMNRGGLIKKATAIDRILGANLVTCALRLSDDRYALGTKSGGVLIVNGEGRLLESFSAAEGLQNNNVLRIGRDNRDNLWLGLENGVSCVSYNSAIRFIYPDRDNKTLADAVRVFDHKLYIGTSDGLYETALDPQFADISAGYGSLHRVPGTAGRVWHLRESDNRLFIAHEAGGMALEENKIIPVIAHVGVWDFAKLAGDSGIIAGTYTGLRRIETADGQHRDQRRVNSLYESLECIATDDRDQVWASHPYRGIFKCIVRVSDSSYRHYGSAEGLPSDMNNYVFRIGRNIVAATVSGVYRYDEKTDRFTPSAFFKPILGETPVEYLKEDDRGNIWFVSDERVGLIVSASSSDPRPRVIYFPELSGQTVKGFASIYPYDPQNIFIGSNRGIIHLNYEKYVRADTTVPVLISSVKAVSGTDSLIYGGYLQSSERVKLASRWNSFHFEYASPLYAEQAGVTYSYKLEGFDRYPSPWTNKTEKEYTNLPPGNYTFSVIARNKLNNLSAPARYAFTVEPAWYQTGWAYAGYFLLLVGLAGLLLKWEQRRFIRYQQKHEEEQKRLQYLHSLEMDRKEKGIIALQNEKLAAELEFKNKELATATMHLVERGGFLVNIKEELIGVLRKLNKPELSNEFKTVFRMMSDTEKNDDDWNSFAIHFDQVHNNFLSTLKAKFPGLSATDLKLCAYLRLNLSSKEIAQLLNISLKGVEISRYRIRKKFQLSREINLYDFLIDVTKQDNNPAQ
ncbi:MAG TPA: triple tyrosine motif-containing protein, partial [Puia sp.]|nr:triple tyrosine motif-containing protein [Puia sp.]